MHRVSRACGSFWSHAQHNAVRQREGPVPSVAGVPHDDFVALDAGLARPELEHQLVGVPRLSHTRVSTSVFSMPRVASVAPGRSPANSSSGVGRNAHPVISAFPDLNSTAVTFTSPGLSRHIVSVAVHIRLVLLRRQLHSHRACRRPRQHQLPQGRPTVPGGVVAASVTGSDNARSNAIHVATRSRSRPYLCSAGQVPLQRSRASRQQPVYRRRTRLLCPEDPRWQRSARCVTATC